MIYRCPICANAITGGTGEFRRPKCAGRLQGHFVRRHPEVADPLLVAQAIVNRRKKENPR